MCLFERRTFLSLENRPALGFVTRDNLDRRLTSIPSYYGEFSAVGTFRIDGESKQTTIPEID